ncbi:MAG: type 4a pilus biogenesis protein PilO [Deltaproteobacteria bacterium]|nr:type 4a pilus biogenesis protein PilO [Deltaproteobacteria bacterium]
MGELLRKLHKLTLPKKVGVTVGVILLLALVDYQFFYGETATQIASANAHQAELTDELAGYKKRRGEYLGYRNELKQLQDEQRELLRALPKRAEIPTFLANIQEQAESSGLEVLSVDIGQETPLDLYIKIPVKMEVRGSYHQISRFFRNVGELQRIVNIENLSLSPDRDKVVSNDPQGATPPKLRAKFIAATFRFNEKTTGGGGT